MAREIVLWCDRHLHEKSEHVPGRERRIGLSHQWWSADLCDDCSSDLTDRLAQVIATAGRSVIHGDTEKSSKTPKLQVSEDTVGAPPNYVPTVTEVANLEINLEMRRNGKRKGRPGKYGQELPCVFCGLTLGDGGNGMHMQAHGFTSIGKALGSWCPWCGKTHVNLGAHVSRSHADRLQGRAVLTRVLIEAHLMDAPYSRLEDVRARGLNVKPLDDVLRNFDA